MENKSHFVGNEFAHQDAKARAVVAAPALQMQAQDALAALGLHGHDLRSHQVFFRAVARPPRSRPRLAPQAEQTLSAAHTVQPIALVNRQGEFRRLSIGSLDDRPLQASL